VLSDVWEQEARFARARHKVLAAYYCAYQHGTDSGIEDIFGKDPQCGVPTDACNFVPKQMLSARLRLRRCSSTFLFQRWLFCITWTIGHDLLDNYTVNANQVTDCRVLVDMSFRRPGFAPQDDYLVARCLHETSALHLEASIVATLATATAELEQQQLRWAALSAVSASKVHHTTDGQGESDSPGTVLTVLE
jgi:hypothetical protein